MTNLNYSRVIMEHSPTAADLRAKGLTPIVGENCSMEESEKQINDLYPGSADYGRKLGVSRKVEVLSEAALMINEAIRRGFLVIPDGAKEAIKNDSEIWC